MRSAGKKFRMIDQFPESFAMRIQKEDTSQTSYFGACCSIVLAIMLVGFMYAKVQTLLKLKDVDIFSATQDFYFPDSETFSAKDNSFFLAAAITNYDSNRTLTESPEYGELLIEHYGWGNAELGYSYGSHPLPNHICTDEELGFERTDKTRIFPVFPRSLAEVDTYRKKFKCIDEESLVIWGDYNSAMAMQLAVKFHMCEGKPYCKSKDEIRNWLSGKYIVLLYNSMRFLTEEFGEEKTMSEARIIYIPISSQIRELIPYKVTNADLFLQDHLHVELDDLTL